MAYYTKICIVCTHSFHCMKITALCCGKKCRNRMRYLPMGLKQELIRRNNAYIMKANNYTAMVRPATMQAGVTTDAIGTMPEGATSENPGGKDHSFLVAHALELKKARSVKIPVDLPVDTPVDEEAMNMDLEDEEKL